MGVDTINSCSSVPDWPHHYLCTALYGRMITQGGFARITALIINYSHTLSIALTCHLLSHL